MFPFPNVIHLFVNEFPRLRRCRLPLPRILARSAHCLLLWHTFSSSVVYHVTFIVGSDDHRMRMSRATRAAMTLLLRRTQLVYRAIAPQAAIQCDDRGPTT